MRAIGFHDFPSEAVPGATAVRSSERPYTLALAGAVIAFCGALGLSVLHLDSFDSVLARALNTLSHRSLLFDTAMQVLTLDMLSNLIFISAIWYAWFATEDEDSRAGICIGTVASFLATGLSRGLQRLLPTHPRPLHNASLGLRLPYSVDPHFFPHWSSFASDHATVYFGLATVLWMYSPRQLRWPAAIAAAGFSLVRVYLCLHYPTDVIGGAALGVMTVLLTRNLRFGRIGQAIASLEARNKPLFYAVAFYVCFGFATLFNEFRELGHSAVTAITHLHHG